MKTNKKLSNSYIADKENLKKKAKEIKRKNLSWKDKILQKVKKQPYFTRLFPLVKEEKPGRDLYAKTTFWQFVICFFMINYYSKLDSRGTQILENTNQYSYHMTVLVFIQVGMMIMERYISRTNVRRHNRSKNAQQVLENVRKQQGLSTGKSTSRGT